jgi:AraC-like DNA-binding protein
MKIRLALTSFILILAAAAGCEGEESAKLELRAWHISPGGADIENPVKIKDAWRPYVQEFPVNNNVIFFNVSGDETAWLRGEFTLTEPHGRYGVIIKGANRSAEIYINSRPIEKSDDNKFTNVYTPAHYLIPGNYLRKGDNVIHVRTRLAGGYTALTKNISILKGSSLDGEIYRNELIFTQFPLAILIFNLSILFPAFIFFLWNRRIRILGFSAAVLIIFILYIALEFIPVRISGSFLPAVHLAMIPLFGVLLFLSFQSLYRIHYSILTRIIGGLCLSVSLVILLADRKISEIYSPYLFLAGLVLIIPISIIVLYIMDRTKRDRIIFFMMTAVILLTGLLGLYEIMSCIFDGPYVYLTAIYASPPFVIAFIVLTAREFMKSIVRMELLYNTIRKPEKKEKDPIITDTVEGKLKSVIDFIDLNYTEDISREGLAGAIDINMDYMGRLFRKYTGKKINEYINELRIGDAMKKLGNRDTTIIDVALSIGFESLSTFNRAFKNVTGQTPSAYRNRLMNKPEEEK